MDTTTTYIFQSTNYVAYDVKRRYAAGSSCVSQYIAPPGYIVRANGKISMDVKIRIPNCYGQGQKFLVSRDGNKNFSDADIFCGSETVALDSVGNEMSLGYISEVGGQGRFQVLVSAVSVFRDNCNCGWGLYYKFSKQQTSRTYKGYTSTVGVLHVENDEIICTGVIITYKHVLSSAHCYFKSTENTAQNLQIITGYKEYPTDDDPFNLATYQIESIKIHEKYSDTDASQLHDIAMIKTTDFIKFMRSVSPICLPISRSFSDDTFYVSKTFEFVGWSTYNDDGLQQFVENNPASSLDVTKCAQHFKTPQIGYSHLCLNRFNGTAKYPEYPGAASFFTSGDRKFLIGLFNFQIKPTNIQPLVFLRVANYISWIKTSIGNDFLCTRYF